MSSDDPATEAPGAEALAQRRRRRREAERHRRAAIRRRRLLLAGAMAAFVGGLAVGSGRGGEESAGTDVAAASKGAGEPAVELEPPTMVSGFEEPVPILMYHVLDEAPVGAAYPDLFVPPREFEAQMDWLAANGFHAVTLGELFAAWEEGAEIPDRPVVVSFDDGYASHHRTAMPKLSSLGWPGVLNLKVGALDEGELDESQVLEMAGSGWEIGSHTITHPDVSSLSGGALRREVGGSRRILERRLGVPVEFFCFPAGDYDEEAVAAVRRAGYRGATTTADGLAGPEDDPFLLKRIRVSPGDGKSGLARKLAAAGAA